MCLTVGNGSVTTEAVGGKHEVGSAKLAEVVGLGLAVADSGRAGGSVGARGESLVAGVANSIYLNLAVVNGGKTGG